MHMFRTSIFVSIFLASGSAVAVPIDPGDIGTDVSGVEFALGNFDYDDLLQGEVTFANDKHLQLSSGYIISFGFAPGVLVGTGAGTVTLLNEDGDAIVSGLSTGASFSGAMSSTIFSSVLLAPSVSLYGLEWDFSTPTPDPGTPIDLTFRVTTFSFLDEPILVGAPDAMAVPEPPSAFLIAIGMLVFVGASRRRI